MSDTYSKITEAERVINLTMKTRDEDNALVRSILSLALSVVAVAQAIRESNSKNE